MNIKKDTNRYHDAVNSVQEFSRQYHVPPELRDRIRDHIVSSWTISRGIDAKKVFLAHFKAINGSFEGIYGSFEVKYNILGYQFVSRGSPS